MSLTVFRKHHRYRISIPLLHNCGAYRGLVVQSVPLSSCALPLESAMVGRVGKIDGSLPVSNGQLVATVPQYPRKGTPPTLLGVLRGPWRGLNRWARVYFHVNCSGINGDLRDPRYPRIALRTHPALLPTPILHAPAGPQVHPAGSSFAIQRSYRSGSPNGQISVACRSYTMGYVKSGLRSRLPPLALRDIGRRLAKIEAAGGCHLLYGALRSFKVPLGRNGWGL